MIHEHSRESDEDDDIPRWLRWTFIAINRVGFPIVAFFFMWYFATVSMKKLSDNMDRQSTSLEALIITINANHADGKEWHTRIYEKMNDLSDKLRR